MAIDFPNSPTLNQQFTAAGATWVWDGVKWTPTGTSPAYLPLVGGALTGDLSISGPDANTLTLAASGTNWPGIKFNIAAGKGAWLGSYVGANERWELDLGNGVAESGNNAGSNFQIARYADNGAFIDDPIVINRASGIVYTNAISAPNVIGDNRLINGDMRIDQRNNGAAVTPTASVYVIDRWQYMTTQGSKISLQSSKLGANGVTAGLGYALAISTVSAYTPGATDNFSFAQYIEADMVADFAWGTTNAQSVTLSFWISSSITGTFSGAITNAPLPATRTYVFTFNVTAANTWQKVSITIPGDTAGTWVTQGNALGVALFFDLGMGSNYRTTPGAWVTGNYRGATGAVSLVSAAQSVSLTNIKLEVGSVATPFNHPTLAKALADCQRYYQVGMMQAYGYGAAASTVAVANFVPFPVTMRAQPTLTPTWTTQTNCTGLMAVQSAGIYQQAATATAVGNVNAAGTWTASAEL